MVSLVVVAVDERGDLDLELLGCVVVIQGDDALHRAVIPLDFTLRHRMERLAPDVLDSLAGQILLELSRYKARTIIAQ